MLLRLKQYVVGQWPEGGGGVQGDCGKALLLDKLCSLT